MLDYSILEIQQLKLNYCVAYTKLPHIVYKLFEMLVNTEFILAFLLRKLLAYRN